jgi:hypothetical protein
VPKEIKKKEELTDLLPKSTEIRVVKKGDSVKLKLRTKEALYTFITTSDEVDAILKGVKTPIVEF